LRFVVTGEWDRNRLLQVIIVLYCFFVGLLWLTNWMLYFDSMDFTLASVVDHYLGNEEEFRAPRSYRGMVELAHFHLFAMGMLLLVLTHLMLFVPVSGGIKAWLITIPFLSALLDEGGGWLVRFASPHFAWLKIAGFLLLQGSLAVLLIISLWAVFSGSQQNYSGEPDPP